MSTTSINGKDFKDKLDEDVAKIHRAIVQGALNDLSEALQNMSVKTEGTAAILEVEISKEYSESFAYPLLYKMVELVEDYNALVTSLSEKYDGFIVSRNEEIL